MKAIDVQNIAQLTNHAGYFALVAIFQEDLKNLEQLMDRPGKTRDEDMNLLAKWRCLRSFLEKLEKIPMDCEERMSQQISGSE